ncbi:MAG: radical SAM family heme chaperone HemW, partial [Thiohalomonadales bacterium]|nr:radical SAM family heme chaperone HemW [Thiohalomonadales bacterium]
MFQFSQLPPLSLYIHFPWCVRKCPYCDFNSHEVRDELAESAYIDALIVDLEQELPRIWGRSISSIFMGGGTPSLFSANSIDRLLSALRARLTLAPNVEITLEANPGTVERERFAEFHAAGINRLSLGIQSFQDPQLQLLGRIHDSKDAIKAVETAHAVGFDNFNLDLMFALPAQTRQTAQADLQTALSLAPSHLSYYQLTIEPNTLFHSQPPELPDDDLAWAMQCEAQAGLAGAGYTHYEVSAYAQPGRECHHNRNYWQFGDYLGIGAGAHEKITDMAQQSITRSWKVKHPDLYLKTAATEQRFAGSNQLKQEDIILEFMLNALRLTCGFTTDLFQQNTGLPLSSVTTTLQQAAEKGWLCWQENRIYPSEEGQRFHNDLVALFL